MKMKEIGPRGGASIPCAPLGSVNGLVCSASSLFLPLIPEALSEFAIDLTQDEGVSLSRDIF